MPDAKAGSCYAVVRASRYFPRDFVIVDVRPMSIVIENAVERYSVTPIAFDAAIANGSIRRIEE